MTHPLQPEYRRALEPWCRFARTRLYNLPQAPDQTCYGIGNHGHWSLQAHDTAFAALAVLAADPGTDPARTGMSRDELRATALRMLNFTLRTHHAGGGACTDGQTWGHTWISALGLERLMHGVDALGPELTSGQRDACLAVLRSEADWLLESYPVKAGLVKDNKPESNIWNGALLHRAAMLMPDATRAGDWREKGTVFLLNGISTPADAVSDAILDGKPVRARHVGANMFDTMACNHHGYLNVGYMVICLSNVAMFHFACRARGVEPPAALHHRARELWNLVRACTFPDGRLLRIGGDTRIRYCYCQDYGIPTWLLADALFHDDLAPAFETGWLAQVRRECEENPDGAFLGERLAPLAHASPLYHLRLEGDRAATLSMGAYWRRVIPELAAERPAASPEPVLNRWEDDYHGAWFHRGPRRFASWTWGAASKPQGLCLPPDASDMAEWRTNLAGRVRGVGMVNTNRVLHQTGFACEGGFATCGRFVTRTQAFVSEGDSEEDTAVTDLAFAALPDDATVVVLQRARTPQRVILREVQSLFLQIPNDHWNRSRRTAFWQGGRENLLARPGRAETRRLPSRWLNLDDRLGVRVLYGAPGLVLHRPADRQIPLAESAGKPQSALGGGSLYAEEIGLHAETQPRAWDAGVTLFDIGCAIRCSENHEETAAAAADLHQAPDEFDGDVRLAAVRGANGALYLVIAHFGEGETAVSTPLPAGVTAAQDCRTGEPLPVSAGALSVVLETFGVRLVRLM